MNEKQRVILHCDCNSFFASVETALNPEYKNVPMAVCGSVEDRHGIVLAKNELAKKYKIQTAETVFSAKKKCPGLVIAKPHYEEYSKYSRWVNRIYSRYTELIEPFGIDESWLDVTASIKHFGSGEEIAEKIRQSVKSELGITVSIGVSFNKIFAKLGSDYKKPDAITVISPENFKEIVFPLKTSDMIYIGKKTADFLYSIGIKTIGELASTNPQVLISKLGKAGEQIYLAANGLDNAPVLPPVDDTTKSISNGFTFRHNLVGFEECRLGCDYLSEEVGARLRKHRQKCATVSVAIKDEFLRVVQKQKSVNPPTNVAREISSVAMEMIRSVWNENKPIRMITVSASNLIDDENFCEQIDFFDEDKYEKRQKEEKLEIAIDKIRRKFGGESIVNGAFMDSDIGIYKKKQP